MGRGKGGTKRRDLGIGKEIFLETSPELPIKGGDLGKDSGGLKKESQF